MKQALSDRRTSENILTGSTFVIIFKGASEQSQKILRSGVTKSDSCLMTIPAFFISAFQEGMSAYVLTPVSSLPAMLLFGHN